MKYSLFLIAPLWFISACSYIPPEAYMSRGEPEALLDVSSEVVNLDISSEPQVDELVNWMQTDQPSRAELYCQTESASCKMAANALDVHGVDYRIIPSAEQMATLVYERVLARDCVNRYIDNSVNPYHLNHPSLGCSIAANMVQQVSDKSQFVRPALLDRQDAAKAIQGYQNYMIRSEPKERDASDSLLSSASSE